MPVTENFVLTTVGHFYNITKPALTGNAEATLSEFINNSQTLLLQSVKENGHDLNFYTKIHITKEASICFYKTVATELTTENSMKYINVVTLTCNAAESLYHILKQIFSPLITSFQGNDLHYNKLQNNLSDMISILRIVSYGKGTENTNVIFSIEDELEYWTTIGHKKESTKKEKDAASNFSELFSDIIEEIRTMHSTTMSEVREATENIGGLLDDVWRYTTFLYPQDRMIHVFDIIGHKICYIIQNSCSSHDFWDLHNESQEYEILNLLLESSKVIQTWTNACKSLTETYWPNYALHPWIGKPYVPSFCSNFETRINEIYDMRSTYCQLLKLLSSSERSELETDKLFDAFKDVDIWLCNGTNSSWETAVSRFAANLRPAETKIAEKLKPRLHNTSTKQMLYEFMRYQSLIQRPYVKQALNNELEIFVSSLLTMLKMIQGQLDADELDVKLYQPPEMSPTVHQIQWAKQMEAKVKEIHLCAEKHLKHFDGCKELLEMTSLLLRQLKEMYTQLHEEWSRDLQAQAKNGLLSLSMDKPVVEFSSSSKLMVVNFNPRLVWSELESRALTALGLPPPSIATALDTLTAALTHARALQQVASFHNTLGERMIPSTRPMMLQAALDLSTLVQDQKAVYWDDIEQLTNYTDKLKKIVFKLETQNTYLTSQHFAIRSIVEKLLDTELLAKQADWKKSVKEIRDVIEKVEKNGYKNTDLWRSHWDWQLYKALECQYIKTLLCLHKYFPHFRVDLVLRGHMVRLQPPIEEIRVQHYHQLRRLVSMPASFVGVQTNLTQKESIFAAIVEKHSWLGNKAVAQIEAALTSLERTCKEWTKRAALACVEDLDALCKEHLCEPKDWELNFKACKAYGQAVAKMIFEDEKIDWITVGTVTLRREFEAQTRTLWACLMSSLQSSCLNDAASIEAFVANAHVTLENKALPKNSKELAEVSAKQQTLQAKIPQMEKTIENLKKKSHMLRTWGGDTTVDGTIQEWKRIYELLIGQRQLFEQQAEIVKSSLSGEWENLNTTVEACASRWNQNKLRYEETHGVCYTEMVDRCRSVYDAYAQWEKYVNDRDDLMKECEKFNMKVELHETWRHTEKLMSECMILWSVFNEYNEDYESIAQQEWIIFQKKLHLLEELVSKWKSRLEPYTTVTLYIQQELEKYTDLSPSLKYLRGSDFTERHWREVFNLLDIEYKKPDTLLVKDLLAASLNIKKHVKELQKICACASSESAIRSALNELELWYAGAKVTIVYYNNKTQKPIPIVKDFKDILSKIEEQQWVVSSVGCGDAACSTWETRLRSARALLRALYHAQRRWLYLEPILSNDDDELGIKFRKVDQGFRQVTRIVESDPRLSALLQSSRVQSMLDSISEQLHACQSALNQYIDEKRTIFPRLYFLSDDDLLELLGQARAGAEGREAVMQTHLKKLFPGITSVKLGPGHMSITALCSHFGEIFQLDHPVDIDCPVEVWLKNLENEMRSSLKNITLKCVVSKSLQEQDPFSMPTQILCLTQNIRFTEQAEKAIATKELHKLKAIVEKENLCYASAEVESENERQKRQALILQCAYYINVIRALIDNNVVSTNDWLWQKQLRFYLLNTKEVIAKMGLAQISYSYEYLGVNTGQFVRTELADECFLVLTQSLHFGFVGNPFGPAGTGKTESVKALGGLFGRLVLIFNCDEAMDAECMGRLLSGLALSGAWGCFDEFNRLTAETLAAVSHQLSSLLAAMHQQKSGTTANALLNGKQISVSEWCGVAATMNPVGRGYGGRRSLPTALERVLRPIAMVQPRGDQLSSHLLAARCIPHSDVLARDLHNVFVMAGALLSGQRHYDWGLRALKAAVGSCGTALAGNPQRELKELRAVAKHVLTLNNVSKLTRYDAERFESILSLVFGDAVADNMATNNIKSALEVAVQNLKLIPNEIQTQKCVELIEQLQQRMGVVIVGPPGSGKTTIRRLLRSALVHQGKNIVEYVICPKAMIRDWLLGNIDHDTRQWTDGVISATALEISNQPSDITSWVVCDGDIDPEWIEALNSVLDENRLLTLPSGWRIQFGSNVNFIFETHSLEHASPATVSRMGIILMGDDVNCDALVLEKWIQKADSENDSLKPALPILQQVIKKSIQWINTHKSDVILKLHNITMVQQILIQFEYIMQNIGFASTATTPEDMVYLAVERSLFVILKETSIGTFQEELSNLLGPCLPSTLLQFEWVSDSLLMSPRLSKTEPMLRACFASDRSHLLVIGPEGCAKNILTEYILKESNSNVITIVCTPLLEPCAIIAELKRNNLIRSGGAGGAPVTLLVRALHRARVDSWGSSPVHSFLLQLIHHGGFWNRDSDEENSGTQWCYVSRVRVVAIASSVTTLSPRLSAAFAQCTIPEPEDDEILELIINYLRSSVENKFKQNDISSLAEKILSFFKEVTETFYTRFHYKWNASHLKKWCENVKWHSPSNAEELLMAIVGEANFIFNDRLVLDDEKSEYIALINKHFKINTVVNYYACKLHTDGVYMEYVDYNFWYQTMEKLINQCLSEHEYNVFGDNGVEVCSELAIMYPAVARTANGGLLVCVGSAGCGRRACAVIGAASLPATLFFVNHTSQFNAQFKNALSLSGEGTRTIVVICESAVNAETLARVETLRRAHSIHTLPASLVPNSNTPHLLQNIKQNLGIMICLDEGQDDLAEFIEKHPMIYNDGHLIWLDRISDASLRGLPQLIIQRLMKENAVDVSKEELSGIPIDGFVSIYNSLDVDRMRAPCRYFNFIRTYYNLISSKRSSLLQRESTLSTGVEALRKARSEVKTLQEDAAEQSAALADKRARANQALDQISATVRATTDKKEEMHELKKNIEIENEKLQQQKKEIEAELASVEPVIAAARAAVGDIRPESLSEVRSLRAPPDVVRDVLEGVLRLMGIADTSWHSMKNFLSKRGVKEDIRCMDASQISPSALDGVRRLLERRGASFDPNTAKRASAACAPLASWVIANLHHADALVRVKPLQAQQAELHRSLKEAENQLDALSSGLATVDERVAALKEQLGQHTHDAAAIELRLTNATNTIQAAKQLLDQLAHEYAAWEADLEYISKEINELSARSLLAAAYIIYLPEVTEPQARESLKNWSSMIEYEDTTFSVINFLSTTEKQLKWDADGLPSDQSAVKNAVLVDQVLGSVKCGFTPLIVDPDGDGINWLKNTLANTQCDFISQQNEKLQTAVQYAVRLGRVLVITDVDSIHECWSSLLYGLPINTNTGSAPITVRLILHCRDETLPSRLPPYYTARLSVLHFTARLDGLTDQLVYFALQQQNPEMTQKTKDIKLKKATLQKQQQELQESLLKGLSSNSDILHDTNLIASLNNTRITNATIVEALEAASTIEESSRTACELYTPSARKTARLALAVRRLAAKWPLIALPVDVILDVYVDAIRRMGDQSKINNEETVKYITRRIIERVLLGLHKKDKYIVVVYLLKEVYEDLFPDELWQLFVGSNNGLVDDMHVKEVKHTYPWMPDDCVKKIISLKAVNENLFNRLNLDKADMWKEYLKSGDTNLISTLKLTPFEAVVSVSILRSDSLYRAIVALVDQVLGGGAVSGGGAIWRAARCGRARRVRPLLVLGSHATDVLAAHAHANNHAFTQIDIDESRTAWDLAVEKARSGGWVALVVGASPFTPQLQAFITSFSDLPVDDFGEEFRLWIVSEDREIPPLVSNACINVILESPEGVKNNVMGTLSAWGNYEADARTVRLHACLALFHALVQERRAYIPQGWSRWYAWEWGEVQACAGALRTKGAATPLCLALYTSRVSVDADKALLSTLHRAYLSDAATSQQWRPKDMPIRLPYGDRLQIYTSAFDGLPDIDSPQLLGLPANCRVGWEKTSANNIVAGLKELNSSAGGAQKNSGSAAMKVLLGLWKKLMSGSPLIKTEHHFEISARGWWGCVCGGEARAAARAAAAVHAALALHARNLHAHHSLLNKVPDAWQLLWAGPDSPDTYIKEFCFRAKAALSRLNETDINPDYMPSEIDLRSLLQPARVVWALRVRTALRAACPVDALALTVKWDCKDEQSGDGMVVRGLRLCGAEWAAGGLRAAGRTSPPHAPAPPLLVKFRPRHAGSPLIAEGTIEVPVYTNEMREEIVFSARAPLAREYERDTALLNAIALFIAPVD